MVSEEDGSAQQSLEEIFEWYLREAYTGDRETRFFVGYLYYTGTGVEQSNEKALEWFRMAAEEGEPNAKVFLDLMNREGEVEALAEENYSTILWASQPDCYEMRVDPDLVDKEPSEDDSDVSKVCYSSYGKDVRRKFNLKRRGLLKRILPIKDRGPYKKVNKDMSKTEILRQYQEFARMMMGEARR